MNKHLLLFSLSLLCAGALHAEEPFQNLFLQWLRSGKINTAKSGESPAMFQPQDRDGRWRNTFCTGVPIPYYETWRTKPVPSDAPQTLTVQFNGTVNPGTILAFAADTTDTLFTIEGFSAPPAGIITLPVGREIGSLTLKSTKLEPVLINNWGSRKELTTPLKAYQFSLHGLYAMVEQRVNIAPFARPQVSGISLQKQADAPRISAAGLNDNSTWHFWRSEKLSSGQTARAELLFPSPATVRETVLYFAGRAYDLIPKAVKVSAETENGSLEIGTLEGLKKEQFKGKFFYRLRNPQPDAKIRKLIFEFTPQKDVAAVSEILVLAAPGDNPGLKLHADKPYSKEFSIPRNGGTFASAVLVSRTGERVRNLAPGRADGDKFIFSWDGLDESGLVVPEGTYQLKGATRGNLRAEYNSTPYMPNPIPWVTPDRKGGWLSDHVPASTIEFAGGALWIGAPFAESGDTIMQLTQEGKKLWGVRWLNLSGAWTIREQGGKIYVASGGGWLGNKLFVTELDPAAKDFKQLLKIEVPKEMAQKKDWKSRSFNGFAVNENTLYLSYSKLNRIDVYGKDGKKIRTIALPAPGAMRFHNGELYLISGNKLLQYDPAAGTRKEIISKGLVKPGDFSFHNGKILVADTGANQVKLFSMKGKLLKTIGKGTPRKAGKFDPLVLDSPIAVAADSRGQIWIAEFSTLPKRISVWSQEGKFLRDYLGPARYEAGSWMDPDDINTYYAEGMIFKRIRGEWKLDSVYLDTTPAFVRVFLEKTMIPERPLKLNGNTFLANDRHWSQPLIWYGVLEQDHILKPHVALGTYEKIIGLFRERPENYSGNPKDYTFLWVNSNNDGNMQWNEIQFLKRPFARLQWCERMGRDLTLYWQSGNEIKKLQRKPGSGLPDYDLAKAETLRTLAPGEYLYAMAPLTDGQLLLNMKPLTCISQTTGRTLWTYRNAYPSNSHDSPLPAPGEIQHTLNAEGEVSVPNFGKVFLLNGNKGLRYLFSGDGIFLGTLFADQRLAEPLSISNVQEGMDLSHYSLMDEAFCGTFERGADGKVYFSGGKNHHSIYEIKGLDSLKRFSQDIRFSSEERKQAEESRIREIQKKKAALIETPSVLPRIQGNDWKKVPEQKVFSNGKVFYTYRLAYDNTHLRGQFQVNDPTPFLNNGGDWKMLFKTGDSINLEFASANGKAPSIGDIRLLIAPLRGQAVAVAYRYKLEGDHSKTASEFSSPIGKTVVDKVEILKNAKIHVNRGGNYYQVDLSIPLADLPPLAKETFYYDAGVIFSDASGSRNSFNLFHHSPLKGITADVPSEIRLTPNYMKKITKLMKGSTK